MPIPILFIGIAAVTGAVGLGNIAKGGKDHINAKHLNENSDARAEEAAKRLDLTRRQCEEALEALGQEKISVLNGSIAAFVEQFKKIKNVDLAESEGLLELKNLHIDHKTFNDMEAMSNLAVSFLEGTAAGVTGGALAAFGAYGAAMTCAHASTGIAISALHGAAASNATLAFFGGGSVAAGGLGMAGGTAVLGGLVAGPALAIMGTIVALKSEKNLELAKMNAEVVSESIAQMENGAIQCISIRRRTYMFYSLLAHMDSYLLPLVFRMEDIIKSEGDDYLNYSEESKHVIASAVSAAVSVKAILDTPILKEDGSLTTDSEIILEENTQKKEILICIGE